VRVPTYDTGVCFLVSEDLEQVAKIIHKRANEASAKWFLDGVYGRKACSFDESEEYCATIWIPRTPVYVSDIATIVHEIFHVTNYILHSRGVELTKSGEAYAYLIDQITNDALRKLLQK
jgi:hypothetical protein